MITQSQIRQISDEIARKFQPERIILFGAYAYGTPTQKIIEKRTRVRRKLRFACLKLFSERT